MIVLDDLSKSILGGDKANEKGIVLDDTSKQILDSTRQPAPNPEDELNPIQKLLTNPEIAKVIDVASGGMSLPEADKNAQDQIDRYKAIPQEALNIGKTLTAGGVLNPNQPTAQPMDLLDAAGKTAGILGMPFTPAAGGIEGLIKGLMTGQNPIQTATKGVLNPASAPLIFSPEATPLIPWEQNGGTERLIPRAVMQGLEQFALGSLMGAPGEVKGAIEKAKASGVQKDFESDFAKINPEDVKAKIAEIDPNFGNMTPDQQNVAASDAIQAFKVKLQQNPEIGDYYAAKQNPIKLTGDALEKLGIKGERGSTEGGEIAKDENGNPIELGKKENAPQLPPAESLKPGEIVKNAIQGQDQQSKKEITAYHGSGTKFDEFDSNMRGSITGAKSAKGAIWFTDSQDVAKAYSIYAAETGPVKKLLDEADQVEKIAKKTGKNSDWDKHNDLLRQAEDLDSYESTFSRRKNANVKQVKLNGDFYTIDAKGKTPQELSDEGDIDSWLNQKLLEAKKMGKDGVIFKNLDDAVGLYNKPATHYAVFDSKNIKLLSESGQAEKRVKQVEGSPRNRLGDWTQIIDSYQDDQAKIYHIAKLPIDDAIKGRLLVHYGLEGGPREAKIVTPKVSLQPRPVGGIKDIIIDNKPVGEVGWDNADHPSVGNDFNIKVNESDRSQGVATQAIKEAFASGLDAITGDLGHGKPKEFWEKMGGKVANDKIYLSKESFQKYLDSKEIQSKKLDLPEIEPADANEGSLATSKVSPTIDKSVGITKQKTPITVNEESLLKRELQQTQKASQTGYKAGIQDIKERFKNKKEDWQSIKQGLTDYIRENLPPEHRYKLIPEVRDLNTNNDLGNAILKVEKIKDELDAKKKAEEAKKRFTPEQRKEIYQHAYTKGLIYKIENGKIKDKLQGLLRHYKDASFGEIKSYISELQGSPQNPPVILKLYGDINADKNIIKLINAVIKDWKDINEMEIRTLDMPRIIEKVTGHDLYENNILAENFFDVISGADSARFERFQDELKELSDNSQGILKDTKASSELMRKFEAGEKLSADEQKVVDFLRSKYNMLIKEANQVRAKVGKKPIPYRQNYMTHIQDQNLLTQFFKGDIAKSQEISNEQLDAIRKGDFTKGNMKFNKFAQERKGKNTKNDAIGNYEKYLETLLYEIYMTPAITHARRFTDYSLLRLPRAYEATTMLLNEMAGKPSALDKFMKPVVSNQLVKWLRSQIAKNALIGNISFNLTNIANLTTSTGELGRYTLKGLHGFLSDPDLRALAFKHSSVVNSRKSQFDADVKAISVFNPSSFDKLTPVEKAKVGAKQLQYLVEGLTRIIEYNNTGSTWVGAYLKATDVFKMPQEKAFKYADTITRRTQVGYRSYELPAAMRSDTGKLFLQFQSWTFNAMNHLLYDMKLANIPKQIAKPFTKDNTPSEVRYKRFFLLLGVMMLTNEIYKRLGLREPTSLSSITPRASFPGARVASDLATVTGADNVIKQANGESPSKHKEETIAKSRNRLLSTLVSPFGGAQIARFAEGSILPKNDKFDKEDVVDLYEKALRTDNPDKFQNIKKQADQMAIDKKVLREEAIKSAEIRLHTEVIDLYEQGLIKSDKKLIKKGDDIARVAGFDDDAVSQMEDAAQKRIDKRTEKDQALKKQTEDNKKPGIFEEAQKVMASFKH